MPATTIRRDHRAPARVHVRTLASLALLAAVALAAPAGAGLVTGPAGDTSIDVDYTVGTGMFTSYLVVDFGFTGGDTHGFAYRWNPGDDARGYTMLLAVSEAMDGLEWEFDGEDGVGFGVLTVNFEYPAEGEIGDPDNFWAYWLGDAAEPDFGFEFASVGPSDRELFDGSVDGWYNAFDGTVPSVPLVPAPASLAALVLGGLGALTGRRRR